MFVPSQPKVRKWAQRHEIPLTRAFGLGHVPATLSLGTVTDQVRKLLLLDSARVQDHYYDREQSWHKILFVTDRDICTEALPAVLLLPDAPGIQCPLVQVDFV
ncbi:hypothetical protein FKM82_022465 [Ascaphus truei]